MKRTFFLLFGVLFGIYLQAQIHQPVKWTVTYAMADGNKLTVTYKATIEDGWHAYSTKEFENGPVPTSVHYDSIAGAVKSGELISKLTPIAKFDDSFQMDLEYFENTMHFEQVFEVANPQKYYIKGYVEYMVCDDQQCLPPTEHEFEISVGSETSEVSVITSEDTNQNSSLWAFFWLAFLGGLAAIFTPCVFPMIPMTMSFFLKGSENKAKGRFNAIFYGISIIAIYTVVGTFFALVFGANFANFLSTHWIPNLLFFLIFMIFAASFFGAFEITMPSWVVNKSTANEEKGGLVGVFFMAFTLVLVSFSCTGPIVGAILVASAGGEVLTPIIGMLGFSLAFALPFTFFALFPGYLHKMPKSGGWLNTVKVVLGFIEVALGLKFLSVADQTYHWGLLER